MLVTALALVLSAATPTGTAALSPAEALAAAGTARLEVATTSEHPLDELHAAHNDFDAAFLTDGSTAHLCRALEVADLALRTGGFGDAQERLAWEETRQDDLDRLREDATRTGRANCRHDAHGEPVRPRVALLTDADFPPVLAPPASAPADSERPAIAAAAPTPTQRRQLKVHTVAGAVFTGVGVGLVGALIGAISLRVRYAEDLRLIRDHADGLGELTDADRGHAEQILADSILARNVAIGVGMAGAVSLATGIALLKTRTPVPRAVALAPYAGPLGGGAVLRLKF